MKAKAIHYPDQRPSEPNSKFEIESREDYAVALDRLKALEAGERSEDEQAEMSALKQAVRAWDGRHDRKLA